MINVKQTKVEKVVGCGNKAVLKEVNISTQVLNITTAMSDQNHAREENHDEPLQEMPMNKWTDLQNFFKLDWPRGVSGYAVLEAQRELLEKGFEYGFKVLCPLGKASSGMVAFNVKDVLSEIIVQCPNDDTKDLEDALRRTKLIDWKRKIVFPFAPTHVIECIQRIVNNNDEIELFILPSESFILPKNSLFEVSLPSDISFGLLSQEHADLVNSNWPHKYPDSIWYFQLLISTKSGYGLFRSQRLVAWVFINEAGTLGHLFTVDGERRKGYAELILKVVSNVLLRDGREVFAFCVKGNVSARNLYRKVGFEQYDCGVSWCYLNPKEALSSS